MPGSCCSRRKRYVDEGTQTPEHLPPQRVSRLPKKFLSPSEPTDDKLHPACATQTESIVQVELTRGRQLPLDLVIGIDSSCSVGQPNFSKTCRFLRRLLTRLEWPETCCTVFRYSHGPPVILAQACNDPWKVDAAVRQAQFEAGETRVAPLLKAAHSVLKVCQRPNTHRVVLMVGDDDAPNDALTDVVAKWQSTLRDDGIHLRMLLVRMPDHDPEEGWTGERLEAQKTVGWCSVVNNSGAVELSLEDQEPVAETAMEVVDQTEPKLEEAEMAAKVESRFLSDRKSPVLALVADSFELLQDRGPRGEALLEQLLDLLGVLSPSFVTRAKISFPLLPPFFETLAPFTLEDGEHELKLGGEALQQRTARLSPITKREELEEYVAKYNLEITIVGASGLRGADWDGSGSDPYCTCELRRTPSVKLQTATLMDNSNPDWNFVGCIEDFGIEDELLFKVYDKDVGKTDDLLGRVTLRAKEILLAGSFAGALLLKETGLAAHRDACLQVKIAAHQSNGLLALPSTTLIFAEDTVLSAVTPFPVTEAVAYPCWETAALWSMDTNEYSKCAARREDQWYLRRVYDEEAPMTRRCLGEDFCQPPHKLRALKPTH